MSIRIVCIIIGAVLFTGCHTIGDGASATVPGGGSGGGSGSGGTGGSGGSGGDDDGGGSSGSGSKTLLKPTMTGHWSGSMDLAAGSGTAPTANAALFALPTDTQRPAAAPTGSLAIGFTLMQYADKVISGTFIADLDDTNGDSTEVSGTGSTNDDTITVEVTDGPYELVFTGAVADHVYSGTVAVTDTDTDEQSSGAFSLTRSHGGPLFPELQVRLAEDSDDDFDIQAHTPDGGLVNWDNWDDPERPDYAVYDIFNGGGTVDIMYFHPAPSGIYTLEATLYWSPDFEYQNNHLVMTVYQYGIQMATVMDSPLLSSNLPDEVDAGGQKVVVMTRTLMVAAN